MRARGPGTLGLAAYGAIEQYELRGGEVRDVDNGHLVAWTGNMDYEYVVLVGGLGTEGCVEECCRCDAHPGRASQLAVK